MPKLKNKLAKKWIKTAYAPPAKELPAEMVEIVDRALEAAYVAGFDRAKLLYIDYAKRFLTNPDLKPGDFHEKIFQLYGEQDYPDLTALDQSSE